MRAFTSAHPDWLTEVRLPGYAPDLNPAEGVERTYVLRAAPPVSPDDLASWTPDDHRRAFYGYTAALLTDFDRYLDQEHIDLRRDGAGYRMAGMWMTDEELNELTRGFLSLLQPYMANPATPDRRRRILRTIVLPAPDSTRTEDHNSS